MCCVHSSDVVCILQIGVQIARCHKEYPRFAALDDSSRTNIFQEALDEIVRMVRVPETLLLWHLVLQTNAVIVSIA